LPTAYGAHIALRSAPEHRLPAPTRKIDDGYGLRSAAAQRINRLVDPQGQCGVLKDRLGRAAIKYGQRADSSQSQRAWSLFRSD